MKSLVKSNEICIIKKKYIIYYTLSRFSNIASSLENPCDYYPNDPPNLKSSPRSFLTGRLIYKNGTYVFIFVYNDRHKK